MFEHLLTDPGAWRHRNPTKPTETTETARNGFVTVEQWGTRLPFSYESPMEIPRYNEFRDFEILEYLVLLWPDRSRRAIQDLFARGRIRSAGSPVGARRRLGEVDDLTLDGSLADVDRMVLEDPEAGAADDTLRILFEDSRVTVIAKPSGVPVVPDRSRDVESCLGLLVLRELRERAVKSPSEFQRPRTVHRIDRLTSGLVIFAKSAASERDLCLAFERREVEKEYLALVQGVVGPARLTVNCPVATGRKGKMLAAPRGAGGREKGKSALTRFDVIERFPDATLVVVRPFTGRTHQIRVHAWAAGHPLAVDPLYNPSPCGVYGEFLPILGRLTLHAYRYTLPERFGSPRVFECPLPEDFRSALDRLRSER